MNAYDYFLNSSANSIKEDIKKSGKWQGSWTSFPRYEKDMLSFLGVQPDKRVQYNIFGRKSYLELIVYFLYDFGAPLGRATFTVTYYIRGFKEPKVLLAEYNGDRCDIQFGFGNKRFRPFVIDTTEYDWYKMERFDLNNSQIFGKSQFDNDTKVSTIIDMITKLANEYNGIYKSVFDFIDSGKYVDTFDKCKAKHEVGMASADVLSKIIYNAKHFCDVDITPEDALYLVFYHTNQYNGLVRREELNPDKRIEFILNWAFYDVAMKYTINGEIPLNEMNHLRSNTERADAIEVTKDELLTIIKESKEKMSAASNDLAEFIDAKTKAENYVVDILANAIKEASEKFGIKEQHIYLSTMLSRDHWMFNYDHSKAPADWKLTK